MAETDLPEDVIVNILCYLPVKSLIRFTSVSKQWRSIILSDPKFAISQFTAARQLHPRLLFCNGAPQLLVSLDLSDTASFAHPSSVRHLTFPPELPPAGPDVTLLGSCNGLVFVAFGTSNFFIWNPATRFVMELPQPGFICSINPELSCRVGLK